MNNSKIFELINLLTKEEWKKFKLWLSSPWANSNKKLVTLYLSLESGFPHFEGPKWVKERIYKKVFVDKAYNNKMFNNLLSKFYKELRLFIVHTRLQNDARLMDQLFVKETLERGATEIFEENAWTIIQQIEEEYPKTAKDYLDLNQLYQQLYYQPSTHLRIKPGFSVINRAQNNLAAYYQLQHYKYLHDAEIRAKMLKDTSDEKKESFELPIAVKLYQNRLLRTGELTVPAYLSFKSLYYEHFEDLTYEHQQYFLFGCINDSVNLNANKEINALNELFEHYQFGFKHDLLLHHGKMSAITFNNIILVASHLEKAEFIAAFLPKYYLFLEDAVRADAYRWGKAELAFINGLFDNSLALINESKFESELFNIQSKGIVLRANFECYLKDKSEYDRVQSLYNAIEKYFQRINMLSKPRKKFYIRFTQYLRRLTTLVDENIAKDHEIKQFRTSIANEEKLFGKVWLLKKLNQLFPTNNLSD